MLSERIVSDPTICGGKPVIKGSRVMVRSVLAQLREGQSFHTILQEYPGIQVEDIQACIDLAVEALDDLRFFTPKPAV